MEMVISQWQLGGNTIMIKFKNYLEAQLDAWVTEMQYFESRENDIRDIIDCEKQIAELEEQINVLNEIIDTKEGNIVCFNDKDEFTLICVRITDSGEEIIEKYDGIFTKDTYDEVLETAKCYDITHEFDLSNLYETIQCVNDLSGYKPGINYLVTDISLFEVENITRIKEVSELEIQPGCVVSFDAYDEGSYRILVKEVNGSKIKGIVVFFSACYSDACYPNSSIPIIKTEEVDLSDSNRIVQDSICINEPTEDEKYYERNAEIAQEEFLKTMVPLSKSGNHTYQEVVVRIEKTNVEHPWCPKGTYCQMDITNICEFDNEGEYKNPYVVERTMNANSLKQMEEGYNRYGSLEGVIVPETTIKFQITSVAENEKIKNICSVSVPYSIVKEKGLDILPVKLENDYEEMVQDALKFLSLHEDNTATES